jgi:hypothetical protein
MVDGVEGGIFKFTETHMDEHRTKDDGVYQNCNYVAT